MGRPHTLDACPVHSTNHGTNGSVPYTREKLSSESSERFRKIYIYDFLSISQTTPTPSQPPPFFCQWNPFWKAPPLHVKGGGEKIFFFKKVDSLWLTLRSFFRVGKVIKGKKRKKMVIFWEKAAPPPCEIKTRYLCLKHCAAQPCEVVRFTLAGRKGWGGFLQELNRWVSCGISSLPTYQSLAKVWFGTPR